MAVAMALMEYCPAKGWLAGNRLHVQLSILPTVIRERPLAAASKILVSTILGGCESPLWRGTMRWSCGTGDVISPSAGNGKRCSLSLVGSATVSRSRRCALWQITHACLRMALNEHGDLPMALLSPLLNDWPVENLPGFAP